MSKSDKLTRADLATLLGLVLILLACLLLTSTPQSVYRWMNRDGYTRTEIEVLSPPEGHLSTMRVRALSTGEELSIKRNTFHDSRERRRLPAWYNPEAQLIVGIRLFDERIVSADVYQQLPGGGRVLGEVLANLAAGAGGLYLLLRSPRKKAPRSRSRRKK